MKKNRPAFETQTRMRRKQHRKSQWRRSYSFASCRVQFLIQGGPKNNQLVDMQLDRSARKCSQVWRRLKRIDTAYPGSTHYMHAHTKYSSKNTTRSLTKARANAPVRRVSKNNITGTNYSVFTCPSPIFERCGQFLSAWCERSQVSLA